MMPELTSRVSGDELMIATFERLGYVLMFSPNPLTMGQIVKDSECPEHSAAQIPVRVLRAATPEEITATYEFQDKYFGYRLTRRPGAWSYVVEAVD